MYLYSILVTNYRFVTKYRPETKAPNSENSKALRQCRRAQNEAIDYETNVHTDSQRQPIGVGKVK